MAYFHGIFTNEVPTTLTAPSVVEAAVIAVGTAPLHLAQNPASVNAPVVAYTYNEAVKQLGYSEDFENYTLCEVMQTFFSLYGIAPVVFINVLDPKKHYKEIEKEFSGVTASAPKIESTQLDIDSFKITSGVYVPTNTLVSETDYVAGEMTLDGGDSYVKAVEFISEEKIIDGKAKISYRRAATALGGDAIETTVTLANLTDNAFELPEDAILESVTVTSGGEGNTFQNLFADIDYKIDYADGVATITILTAERIIDDKISVTYHEIDPAAVTAADIIGGVDIATGKTSGIELIESVHPKFGLTPGTLIAPKFSLDPEVRAALVAKAKGVSGIFPAMAVTDIDTDEVKTYTAAVEKKNAMNAADSHLIICYPKVKNGERMYHLSTHLAALMAKTDYENENIPFVSPSNQPLQIDSAVLNDGTEVFLTRDQANLLNQNGIGTALSFNGWRFWGNYTAAYPASNDVKEIYIPVRRMFNYLSATFIKNYISKLDMPITRRAIDSVLTSANIFLNGLVNRGALLGARLVFPTDENSTADLLAGTLHFHLYLGVPLPAQTILFTMEFDTAYISSLLA